MLGFAPYGPGLIGAACWTLLGILVFRSGQKLEEVERQTMAEENRRKALRLYEEAFGLGNLTVVDEVVAQDFFDYLYHRHGPEEFKQTISDLRRTVEEQTAQDDTVTTRCTFSGTDLVGVLWYPPRGKQATFTGTYIDRFSSGRLAEHSGETDTPKLLEQLGLSPSGDS